MFSGIFFRYSFTLSLYEAHCRTDERDPAGVFIFDMQNRGNSRLLCRYLTMFRRLSAPRPDDEPLLSGRHGIVTIENAALLSMMTSLCFRGGQAVYLRAYLNV